MTLTEAKVINAVVVNKDIHTLLTAPDELFTAYNDVYSTIKKHYQKYRAVPTLESLQRQHPDLEKYNADEPTAFYMDELKSEYLNKRMEDLIVKTANALDSDMTPQETLEKLTNSISKLSAFTSQAADLNLKDVEAAERHFQNQADRAKQNGGVPGIPTGFKSLDSVYATGMAPGHSIILFGRTGRGKSLIAALMAAKAYAQGYKPMIVSLEMSKEEQMERIYTILASGIFTMSGMARGEVDLEEFKSWSEDALKQDFIIVSNEGNQDVTPNFIQGKINQHRPDIVILDYMQLMMDNGKNSGMTPRMLALSREIKLLAVSSNIPIISISGITDKDNDDQSEPPTLDQVSWSAGIKYDANLAIAVQKAQNSNVIAMVVRKNRNGDQAAWYLDCDIDRGIFEERFTL